MKSEIAPPVTVMSASTKVPLSGLSLNVNVSVKVPSPVELPEDTTSVLPSDPTALIVTVGAVNVQSNVDETVLPTELTVNASAATRMLQAPAALGVNVAV